MRNRDWSIRLDSGISCVPSISCWDLGALWIWIPPHLCGRCVRKWFVLVCSWFFSIGLCCMCLLLWALVAWLSMSPICVFFLFWGIRPVCVLVYLVVSWWNRRSLYLCSFPHQSNKEHSFLFVVFLVSCVQLSLRDLLQRRVFPVVVVRTWYHLDLWLNVGTGCSCQTLPPCLEICVLL